jgi:DNA polymerase III delta prime subunit
MSKPTDQWVFKHEPKTMDDYLAHPDTKAKLERVIERIPNTMLFGRHGLGKGTFMNIFLKSTGFDFLRLNGSDENSVDVVRDKVKTFAMSKGTTKLKIVYFNEADRVTPPAQEAMLDMMEQVHKITRFFFVGNYLNKMVPELQSRCEIVEFAAPPIGDVGRRCIKILHDENVTNINKNVLTDIIKKFYPDLRKIISTMGISVEGNKLERMIVSSYESKYADILKSIVTKNIDEIRKILRTYQVPYGELYEYLFEFLPGNDKVGEPGAAIIEIAEALYRDYFMINKEINFIGMVMKLWQKGIMT